MQQNRLILGCGYLGCRVAWRWLAAGRTVFGVTRTPEQAREIQQQGVQPIVADVTQPETLANLPPAETVLFAVGYRPDGGKSRWQVYVEGLRAVLDAISPQTRRVILISSTGVYGEAGGDWVDEDSPCLPLRDASRALLAAEQLLADHPLGDRRIVLRLAGIYGPDRLPRMAELRAGTPIAVPPGSYANLIHVDDAAAVVLAAECRAAVPRCYVVSDGHPVDRRTYLAHLAELLHAPGPQFLDCLADASPSRGSGDKRVRNARMIEELGVCLDHPSYQKGLAACLLGEHALPRPPSPSADC